MQKGGSSVKKALLLFEGKITKTRGGIGTDMTRRMFLLAAAFLAFLPGNLFGYSVSLYEYTGADAEIKIEITGDGTNSITFNVNVIKPEIADLRAVWFNFDPFPSPFNPENISVTGSNVTDWSFINDGVTNLGGGANIKPAFDAGIEIGLQGVGGGDYFHSTTFTVSYISTLSLGELFGGRLMSIPGDPDSSKLLGSYSPVSVPESSAVFTLFIGIGLIGLAKFYGGKTRFKRV